MKKKIFLTSKYFPKASFFSNLREGLLGCSLSADLPSLMLMLLSEDAVKLRNIVLLLVDVAVVVVIMALSLGADSITVGLTE